jgi:hypothetical protein
MPFRVSGKTKGSYKDEVFKVGGGFEGGTRGAEGCVDR